MKIPKRLINTVSTAYLYADGHMVLVHRERHGMAGTVEWVTVHQSCDVDALFPVTDISSPTSSGRLVIHHKAALAMLLKSEYVRPTVPSTEGGSKRTRELGIAVGNIHLNFGAGDTWIPVLTDLLGGEFTYQPSGHGEAWADVAQAHTWSVYNIGHHYPEEKKAA